MMYGRISELLSDRKGGVVFRCFDVWHICYILIVFIAVAFIVFYLKNKSNDIKQRAITGAINFAFVIYIMDFFLMPFAYGEIDVEKLPFHVCTAMCVMSFWSRHGKSLEKYSAQFALLGLISNLVYFIYPAGVMWHQVHPLSYRVIQTLLFHGVMAIYGVLALLYEKPQPGKRWHKNLFITGLMTLWAIFGNLLYTGEAWGRSNHFNWFFVTQDPFYLVPADIAPWVMPIINIAVFMVAEAGVSAIFDRIRNESFNRQT